MKREGLMVGRSRLRALPGGASSGGAAPGSEPRPQPTDDELVEAISRGDEWAAVVLYDRLQPVIDRALRRVLNQSGAELDDLIQMVFERIIRTLADQRFAGACSLSTWASAIAGHVAIDALRSRMRERSLFRGEAPSLAELRLGGTEQLENRLEARSELARLRQVLARMNAEQARTLLLHDVLGHELSEISAITGVSIAAAQSRLVRGRKDLLRRLRKGAS